MIASYIDTYTGKRFRLPDPDPGMVCPEDIAHSLSLICRYNGHCKNFYSVAQHCIQMSKTLEKYNYPPGLQLYGLLHDASEAYICDIPGPVKKLIPQYKHMEKQIMQVIWEAFGILPPTGEENRIIKKYDNLLIILEKQEIANNLQVSASDIEKQYLAGVKELKSQIQAEGGIFTGWEK